MIIALSPDLEAALSELARRRGIAPEELAIEALRERFLTDVTAATVQPRDEWERRLLGVATDCGVSLPDSALSREGLYE
jgi:predicted transcriptional regulator